jgi:predicted transcriptional regulator
MWDRDLAHRGIIQEKRRNWAEGNRKFDYLIIKNEVTEAKLSTAMFAEMLDTFQQLIQFIPKS